MDEAIRLQKLRIQSVMDQCLAERDRLGANYDPARSRLEGEWTAAVSRLCKLLDQRDQGVAST